MVDKETLANRLTDGRDASCPRCGGSRPSCCSCPDTTKLWAEHQRLQSAVVQAAKTRRKAKLAQPDGAGDYIMLLHAAMVAEHEAVDALIAFEAEHGIGVDRA